MHIEEKGTGPAVVLLHGAPSPIAHFAPLVEALAPQHRVLVPELPGYGRTPPLTGKYSIARVTALLEEELMARGVRETAVLGYSLGSYRAFALTLSQRVRVTRIYSLAGFAGVNDAERAGYRDMAQLVRTPPAGMDLHPVWVQRAFAPGYPDAHPAEAAQVARWLDLPASGVLADEMAAVAEAEDLGPRLAELEIPITCRVGELDAAAPPPKSREIVAGAPQATLELVPGCGHALLCEDHAATVASVRRALA